MRRLRLCLAALSTAALTLLAASPASAQFGGTFGWNPQSGGYGAPAGQQPYPGPTSVPNSSGGQSSDLEIGTLYATAAAYGVGTGIWFDTEVGVKDPALAFIAPAVLGVGGPVGVYFLDQPHMRRGVPGAISAGLSLGAMEGANIWLFQFTRSSSADAWGGRGLARSMVLGATIGGAGGAVLGFTQEPSPKLSLFVGSGGAWGSLIGSMLGYGTSGGADKYGTRNDAMFLGNLVGYNVGMLAAGGLSAAWVPGYKQLTFMWAGGAVGFAATLPIYAFYVGNGDNVRRGLIAQGIGTTLGIAAGAAFTFYDADWAMADPDPSQRRYAKMTGFGPMALPGGLGAQVSGLLF